MVTRIEYLERAASSELSEMLEGEEDFPQSLLRLYQRPSGSEEDLTAWRERRVDGL